MVLAFEGNKLRGKYIIALLVHLGGKNKFCLTGEVERHIYTINEDNIICSELLTNKSKDKYNLYTIEQFEKEFIFKIGDIVLVKGTNEPYKIIALEWYMDKLCYKLDNGLHFAPKALTIYEKMKEERNITLTLDKAKEWYKKGGELKEIALQAFTEKELNPLPRSWEEFCKKGYWHVGYPKKYEALFRLEKLRDCWRQGWKPTQYDTGCCVIKYFEGYKVVPFNFISFLSFPTVEIAKEFLECFKDLIEQAGDLI